MKVHIDFQEAKQTLNESWMQMFASWTKDIMRHVYGKDVPVIATINEDEEDEIELKIVGQYQDVKSYATAIKAEVDYIVYGIMFSFIISFLTLKFFIKLGETFSFTPFVIYRAFLAFGILAVLYMNP